MPPTLLRVYHTLSQVIPNNLMSWSRSYPPWTARWWIHRWPSLTVSKDWLDSVLRGQFIEERHMCVTKCLDLVHSHFELVHLNNFSLISSYTQTSRPWHGQLPAKQKVGESRSSQGTVAYTEQRPGKCCSTFTTGLALSALTDSAVTVAVWWGGTWPALGSKSPW